MTTTTPTANSTKYEAFKAALANRDRLLAAYQNGDLSAALATIANPRTVTRTADDWCRWSIHHGMTNAMFFELLAQASK